VANSGEADRHRTDGSKVIAETGRRGGVHSNCAALAALAALSAAVIAAEPHRALPRPGTTEGLGVNIHFTDPRPGEIEMLAAAGFKWVRMDFTWSRTEREPGRYDFSPYERLLGALEPYGIRVLFILDYSNRLYERGQSVLTDRGRAAFARWAAAAAQHFRGRGILWEIWNEPNIEHFWKPQPSVAAYAKLAEAAARAIRAAAPGEAVIGPATSGIDLRFLEGCFKAGLLKYWDAVSVHPYRSSGPETVVPEYHRLRRLIAQYSPPGKVVPVLSGEWGYSAAWAGFDPQRQAKMLARQWLTNIACRIPLSIWYDWHDDGPDPAEPEHHFGTVAFNYHAGRDPVYDPKPAYLAAKTLTRTLAGFEFVKRLASGRPDDWLLLFRRGEKLRLAAWTTCGHERTVRLPADDGRFELIDHLGQRRGAVEAHEGRLELTLTDSPQYIVAEAANERLLSAPAARSVTTRLQPAVIIPPSARLGPWQRAWLTIHGRHTSGQQLQRPVAGAVSNSVPVSALPCVGRTWGLHGCRQRDHGCIARLLRSPEVG